MSVHICHTSRVLRCSLDISEAMMIIPSSVQHGNGVAHGSVHMTRNCWYASALGASLLMSRSYGFSVVGLDHFRAW